MRGRLIFLGMHMRSRVESPRWRFSINVHRHPFLFVPRSPRGPTARTRASILVRLESFELSISKPLSRAGFRAAVISMRAPWERPSRRYLSGNLPGREIQKIAVYTIYSPPVKRNINIPRQLLDESRLGARIFE